MARHPGMDLRLHRLDGRRYLKGGYLLYSNQLLLFRILERAGQ